MSNALVIKNKSDPREYVSGRLKRALDLMVWGDQTGRPLAYDEAGRATNISTKSMRKALQRPVVRMYLRSEAEVFRASLTPRSLWHLADISAQRVNMNAAVSACRTVLGQEDQQPRSFSAESPHLTAEPQPPAVRASATAAGQTRSGHSMSSRASRRRTWPDASPSILDLHGRCNRQRWL